MTDKGLTRAFMKGVSANHADRPIGTNPYQPSNPPGFFEAWNEGWRWENGPSYVVASGTECRQAGKPA